MSNLSVIHETMKQMHFSWYDYSLFALMIGGSVAIGIYFGCFGSKQSTANEYLLGGKSMKIMPIAISLTASHVSGITVLSIPADVYKFGSTYGLCFVGIAVTTFATAYVTMPVFHDLQITSTFEYLKLRFDTRTRLMASFLFTVHMILFMPIVIYGPSLAFAQATPIDLHLVNPIMCAICIFYTTIGGLKTVVWSDTLQFVAMFGAIVAIMWIGISKVGGLGKVFLQSYKGGRLDIDFDIDPTKRDTFWAVVIGWSINWIPHVAINQGAIQKCLSLPTLHDVKKTMVLFSVGTIFCKLASVLTGLIIYATYYNCDPFLLKHIEKNDQLLPYYVMDIASKIPGLPGLFIAGVFCAGFSTLSAQMNALSGTIYEDFVSRYMPKDITEKQVSNTLKLIVVIIGIIATSLVLVVEHLGGILPLSIAVSGVTSGPLLGLFALGMLFPSANSKGAFYGSITSILFASIMAGGSQLYKTWGAFKIAAKPSSISGCATNITASNMMTEAMGDEIFPLFRISHYYYSLVGTSIVLAVGLSISWLTKDDSHFVDEKLITPWMRWTVRKANGVNKPAQYDVVTMDELKELNKKE